MIEEIIKILPNLGIGVVAILALVYIVYLFEQRRQQEHDIFMNYISENNHKFTNLVVESTLAIQRAAKSIEKNTNTLEKVSKDLDKIFDLTINQIKQ